MNIREIIKNANAASIPLIEYIEIIPRNTFMYTFDLIKEIASARKKQDDIKLESLLIVATRDGLVKDYTPVFCELLKEDWHELHEDLVMMLEEIKDADSVDCIYTTVFNVPIYDDGRSLAKKCIWALGAINTPKAIEKLKLLAQSSNKIIQETATLQLKHNDK